MSTIPPRRPNTARFMEGVAAWAATMAEMEFNNTPVAASPALCAERKAALDEAFQILEDLCREHLDTVADDWRSHLNLSVALSHRGDLPAAIESARRAVTLAPSEDGVWLQLGSLLHMTGSDPREARACLERGARSENPARDLNWSAHFTALALLGNYPAAFRLYRDRPRGGQPGSLYGPPLTTAPVWRGAPFSGRLLVYPDGGYGDTLWAARFLPVAAERGGRVIFHGFPGEFGALLPGCVEVVDGEQPLPPHNLQIAVSDLPAVLGVTRASGAPYLRAPAPLHRLEDERGALKVGILWSANVGLRDRWTPLGTLRPVLEVPGVAFYSLAVGAVAAAGREAPEGALLRWPLLGTWSDTAATIRQLDLVITVEGVIAHLGGALGVPTWVLTPKLIWYWGFDGGAAPWYDSVRVFRQRRPGDWGATIAEVAAALRERVAA